MSFDSLTAGAVGVNLDRLFYCRGNRDRAHHTGGGFAFSFFGGNYYKKYPKCEYEAIADVSDVYIY
jgi:hypothetical protein